MKQLKRCSKWNTYINYHSNYIFIALIFLPQLLNLFGCTDNLREYALDYGYIIAIGLPFMMIGTTLNSIIRADGSPKFSMISMVSGAVF